MTAHLLDGLAPIHDFDLAWRTTGHGHRLRAVRGAAQKVRQRFAEGPRALAVRSLPLSTLPCPTRFAFAGTAMSPVPYVTLTHRATLVQFLQNGALKNLLFNPTDIDGARATP